MSKKTDKYINEAIKKKPRGQVETERERDYLSFLDRVHSVVVNSDFREEIGLPIIKMID